jgi:transposase
MPRSTFVPLALEEQAQRLGVLRRARDGDLLALPILRWCATGRTPTDIAAVLFCARSSVYRTRRAYRAGTLGLERDDQGRLVPPGRTTVLRPTRRRSLVARLNATPQADGWCRTRWSCATLALTWQANRGVTVSAETLRRWLHESGWVGKRAKLVATDDDPPRVNRLARIRWVFEQLKRGEARVCADALDSPLWPNVGGAWRPKGTQWAVMTPGPHQQHDLAGALALAPGRRFHSGGPRTTTALCRDLLSVLAVHDPAERYRRLSVVVDHDKIHTAKAVEPWLAAHPRFTWLFWPPYGPQANPIERAFGDGHDCGTRSHRHTRLPNLVAEVEDHLHANGPWLYKLSELYDEPAMTTAVEQIAAVEQCKVAA